MDHFGVEMQRAKKVRNTTLIKVLSAFNDSQTILVLFDEKLA